MVVSDAQRRVSPRLITINRERWNCAKAAGELIVRIMATRRVRHRAPGFGRQSRRAS